MPLAGAIYGALKSFFGGAAVRPTAAVLQSLGFAVKVPVGPKAAFDYPRGIGVQAGSTRGYTGREELGGEELGEGDAVDFANGKIVLWLDSSWLSFAKFYPGQDVLEVGLLDPAQCRGLVVHSFTQQEALQFALATSKGRYFWDVVFIRGPGSGKGLNRKTRKPVTWL